MIILNLKLNNIMSFKNFNVNFSYPKKIQNSLIYGEYLKDIPSFRYKKLNIFMGANASGKTSLIKCMWKVLLFLKRKEKIIIKDIINENYNYSSIELDFVDDESKFLHRLKIKTINDKFMFDILISHVKIGLVPRSSYEILSYFLDIKEDKYVNYIDALKKLDLDIKLYTALPATEQDFDKIIYSNVEKYEQNEYLMILNTILKTLDPSILKVSKSKDSKDAYVIEHETDKIIVQEGMKIADIPLLSSGTKYGINIANIIFALKKHRYNLYFIDEQFSYINSELERDIIALMTSLLGPNEQLFLTTHNEEVLSLRFPFHSFYFMKKEMNERWHKISIECASKFENRNNISPKSLLENDVFASLPDTSKIYELGDDE